MNGGNLAITGSTVEGSDSNFVSSCAAWAPPGPALDLYSAVARVTHSSIRGGFDQNNVQAAATRLSGSVLWRDGSVTFTPTASPGAPLFYPGTEANSAQPGGSASAPQGLPITFQGLVVPGAVGTLALGAPVVVQVL